MYCSVTTTTRSELLNCLKFYL